MKIEELRLLIKEVVQETMREELSSILTEAVKIASTPTQQAPVVASRPLNLAPPEWVKDLPAAPVVAESSRPASSHGPMMQKDPMALLAETAKGMSREDLKNFM